MMFANLVLMYLKAEFGFKDQLFVLSERRLILLKILFCRVFHISLT